MFGRYSPQVSTLPKDNQTPPFLRTASGVGSARKTLPADLEDDSFIPPFLRSSHTYDDSCDYGSGPAVFDDLPPTRSRYSPEVDDDDMSGSFTSRLAGPSSPLSAGISATASNRSIAAMDVGGFDQAGPYDLLRCTDDAPDPVSTFFPKTGHSTFDFNYGRVHRPFPEASQPKDDAAQRAGWMRQAKKKSDVMDEPSFLRKPTQSAYSPYSPSRRLRLKTPAQVGMGGKYDARVKINVVHSDRPLVGVYDQSFRMERSDFSRPLAR